jgi:hypothetical protein
MFAAFFNSENRWCFRLFYIDFAVAFFLELCTFQDLCGWPSLDFDDSFINVMQYPHCFHWVWCHHHILPFFSRWSGKHITCQNMSISVGWHQVSDIFYIYIKSNTRTSFEDLMLWAPSVTMIPDSSRGSLNLPWVGRKSARGSLWSHLKDSLPL